MNRLLAGSLAGFFATLPMTVVMMMGYRQLPVRDRFTWPPYKIIAKASKGIGLGRRQGPRKRLQLALAAHFGFGTAAGGLFGLLAETIPLPPVVTGTLYGVVVWAASYLGWLPITGLYQLPNHESPRRQAVLLAAHLIWGPILGLLFDSLHGWNAAGKHGRPAGRSDTPRAATRKEDKTMND